MSPMTVACLLSGSSVKGAKPGKVFEATVDGQYANPVIVADETDKAALPTPSNDLPCALQPARARHRPRVHGRKFAEIAIDASQVIWITHWRMFSGASPSLPSSIA